jgi:hypothetical protein
VIAQRIAATAMSMRIEAENLSGQQRQQCKPLPRD